MQASIFICVCLAVHAASVSNSSEILNATNIIANSTKTYKVNAADIIIFSDADFRGESEWLYVPSNGCIDLTYRWDNRISSIDGRGGCVEAFEFPGCYGRREIIATGTPYHYDLARIGFGDMISAFRGCYSGC